MSVVSSHTPATPAPPSRCWVEAPICLHWPGRFVTARLVATSPILTSSSIYRPGILMVLISTHSFPELYTHFLPHVPKHGTSLLGQLPHNARRHSNNGNNTPSPLPCKTDSCSHHMPVRPGRLQALSSGLRLSSSRPQLSLSPRRVSRITVTTSIHHPDRLADQSSAYTQYAVAVCA